MLCISTRVIALALFATLYIDIFVMIVACQIIIYAIANYAAKREPEIKYRGEECCIAISRATITCCIYPLVSLCDNYCECEEEGFKSLYNNIRLVIFQIGTGISSVYNILLDRNVNTTFYSIYWVVMFIETIVLVYHWYIAVPDKLWYHDVAISYVICAYFASLFIKLGHRYVRQNSRIYPINANGISIDLNA